MLYDLIEKVEITKGFIWHN